MTYDMPADNNPRIHSYYPTHSDHPPVPLPKVGQTRCYWALLSADLHFIYLDPVLQNHLDEQAELLVGKSLLSFVHPDEQRTAKQDLGGVLDSRTLHGSVTRVRFSRLSRVRRQLGYEGPPAPWSDADKIALDKNYMAVDIVINWAAEGLVLCFIHAIVDLTPNDNDEHNKTGWTNWCGTPLMDHNQIQLLYRRLLVCVQRPDTMNRVFQILGNSPGRPLLLSWPPDQDQGQQRPNGRDFATLAENANIGTRLPDGNDAKTSCTRRYKALQDMPPAVGGEVESIFIPHGSVIFACHKVNSSPRSTASSTATMQQLGYSTTQNYTPSSSSSSYYDSAPAPYSLPPLPTSPSYPSYASAYAPQRWAQGPGESSSYGTPTSANPNNQQPWGSPSPAHSVASLPPAVSNLRSGSYPPPPHPSHHWQTPGGPASPGFLDAGPGHFPRTASPTYGNYSPGAGSTEGASPGGEDVVPPARRRVSPGSAKDGQGQYPASGRSAGNRPSGVLKCSSCKATSSPEWRKGPSGKKELCNACGLRYARSRAKKEGHAQPQRRRKDKSSAGITKQRAASATPPTPASSSAYSSSAPAASSMRRSFGDTSFSTGSPSGSEIYHPHHGHGHVLDDKLTPSPSPPAVPAPMSFVHYGPGGPAHPHPHPHPHHTHAGSFYSVPSPLSHPPVQLPLDEHNVNVGVNGSGASAGSGHNGGQGQNQTTLPPLVGYAGRGGGSPLATMPPPPASFEREREREGQREGQSQREKDRDRELPPVPLSLEPRPAHRRGILTQQG